MTSRLASAATQAFNARESYLAVDGRVMDQCFWPLTRLNLPECSLRYVAGIRERLAGWLASQFVEGLNSFTVNACRMPCDAGGLSHRL